MRPTTRAHNWGCGARPLRLAQNCDVSHAMCYFLNKFQRIERLFTNQVQVYSVSANPVAAHADGYGRHVCQMEVELLRSRKLRVRRSDRTALPPEAGRGGGVCGGGEGEGLDPCGWTPAASAADGEREGPRRGCRGASVWHG